VDVRLQCKLTLDRAFQTAESMEMAEQGAKRLDKFTHTALE